MQVVRYRDGGVARLGILEGEIVRAAGGELFGELLPREHIGPLADLALLPPVAPGKIVAIGLNYADHAAEGVVPGAMVSRTSRSSSSSRRAVCSGMVARLSSHRGPIRSTRRRS